MINGANIHIIADTDKILTGFIEKHIRTLNSTKIVVKECKSLCRYKTTDYFCTIELKK